MGRQGAEESQRTTSLMGSAASPMTCWRAGAAGCREFRSRRTPGHDPPLLGDEVRLFAVPLPLRDLGVPERARNPAICSVKGSSGVAQLDRWYLCRNLRGGPSAVQALLRKPAPPAERRRISMELTPRDRSTTPGRAGQRGRRTPTRDSPRRDAPRRLDRLMHGPVISHLLQFTDRAPTGREVGTVLMIPRRTGESPTTTTRLRPGVFPSQPRHVHDDGGGGRVWGGVLHPLPSRDLLLAAGALQNAVRRPPVLQRLPLVGRSRGTQVLLAAKRSR